jgi:PPOX class probable F420-dependent enzyme
MPLPRDLDDAIAAPNRAVVGTVRNDNSPHTAATWYDWDNGRVLLSMDETRARLRHMRQNPFVSITIFVGEDGHQHVTLFGRVESLEDDTDLSDIDRLSIRYTGKPFGARHRRRVTAWVRPERWSAWPLPPLVHT